MESGQLARQSVNMDELSRLSTMVAKSGYFSDARDAAQCGVKILAGREMGFGAIASMKGIHIIKGSPAIGANLMAAAIKRHPNYNYRIKELSDQKCVLEFFERWDGGKLESVGLSEFSVEDARKANTQNMGKFPRNMLFARAISNGIRWYCPDVFDAPVYTPEELDSYEGSDSEPTTLDAEIVEEDTQPDRQRQKGISDAQRKRLFAIAKNNGWKIPQLKQVLADEWEIQSTSDISPDQYELVCEYFERIAAPTLDDAPQSPPPVATTATGADGHPVSID